MKEILIQTVGKNNKRPGYQVTLEDTDTGRVAVLYFGKSNSVAFDSALLARKVARALGFQLEIIDRRGR